MEAFVLPPNLLDVLAVSAKVLRRNAASVNLLAASV